MIRIENLSKRFGDVVAVDDLSLEASGQEINYKLVESG